MKKILIYSLFALVLVSCTNSYYNKIDKALDEGERYEKILLDSLDRLKSDPGWESALKLADTYSHYQIDSCLKYSLNLRSMYGSDKERMLIGECQIARSLRLHGDNRIAENLFESIDTTGVDLSGEIGMTYYYAGYFVYGGMASLYIDKISSNARKMAQELEKFGPHNINSLFVWHQQNISNDRFEEDLAMLQDFICMDGITRNAKARAYNYLSQTYRKMDNDTKYLECKVESILLDIELSIKNYNSLFDVGVRCYEDGDINRARRYIIKSLQDAQFCNQPNSINRSLKVNNLLNEALLKYTRTLITTLSFGIILFAFFTTLLFFMFSKERQISRKLKSAKEEISDLSNIKDTFISGYMEQCAEYINKLDQEKGRLRQIAKKEGVEYLLKELRSPAYSDKEFSTFLKGFDKDFLNLFPDFLEKLDSVMKENKGIKRPKDGTLSTEARILALIRLGIDDRARIANILHTSVGTVYTYHSVVQNNSILSAGEFDSFVKSI